MAVEGRTVLSAVNAITQQSLDGERTLTFWLRHLSQPRDFAATPTIITTYECCCQTQPEDVEKTGKAYGSILLLISWTPLG